MCGIAGDQIRELQVNLVRSHAVESRPALSGGNACHDAVARQFFAKGFSGVRAVVIDTLCEMLNRGVTPFVRRKAAWARAAIWLPWLIWAGFDR